MILINKEEIEARNKRIADRKTRRDAILKLRGMGTKYVSQILPGLGIPKIPGLINRLARNKNLTPTQFYKIS